MDEARAPLLARIRVDEDGTITPLGSIDAITRVRLERFATCAGEGWRIDARSVRAALQKGMSAKAIIRTLYDLTGREDTGATLILAGVRNWAGEGAPRIAVRDVEILRVPVGAPFALLRAHLRVRPHILAVPAPGWLILAPGSRGSLTAILKELGFRVKAGRPPTSP